MPFVIRVATFLSVHSAIAGILASWLDRYPRETARLYAPWRSAREIELLKRRSASAPTNAPPRIHIPRPPASYTASNPRNPRLSHDPRQLAPAQTLPGHSQKVPSHKITSYLSLSFPEKTSGPTPLVLHREVNRPVGQASRKQPASVRIEDLQTSPDNLNPTK